jgi:hypothetical protein
MALTLLEGLPDAIRAAIAAAKPAPLSPTAVQLVEAEVARLRARTRELVGDIARLRADKARLEAEFGSRRREVAKLDAEIAKRRRALERLERPAERCTEPRPPKPHQVLAAALAGGRITAERVAEALARPEDVAQIAAGRVGLAETAWKRLLREIAG